MDSTYVRQIADALEADWDAGFAEFVGNAVKDLDGGAWDFGEVEMFAQDLLADLAALKKECKRRGIFWGDGI